MGIYSQRRWRERGLKAPAPAAPQLPPMVSREFHQDAIAKLTRSYELRLSALVREKIAQFESSEGDADKKDPEEPEPEADKKPRGKKS